MNTLIYASEESIDTEYEIGNLTSILITIWYNHIFIGYLYEIIGFSNILMFRFFTIIINRYRLVEKNI